MSTARVARWAWVLITAAVPLGCQPALGRLAWIFEPPQKVKALYDLPPRKTVLVFVDDVLNPLEYQPVKMELTERLNAHLIQKKLVADIVPYEMIVQWTSRTTDLDRLSVSEVGQALGAELVLYVHLDKFRVKEDERSPLWHGQMATTVRVVDVYAGRLWPQDRPEGYAVPQVETPTADNPSASYGAEVTRQLTEAMAEEIINLFCDHTVPASEPPPPPGHGS